MEIDQDLLEKVRTSNNEFRKLYDEHLTLKSRVEELNKMKAALRQITDACEGGETPAVHCTILSALEA